MTADEEEEFTIAQANVTLRPDGKFAQERVSVRHRDEFLIEPIDRVDYMDVSTRQLVSLATAMIPFLEHDDANRALMGANMQRQAVPLLVPESPYVGTGTRGSGSLRLGSLGDRRCRWSCNQRHRSRDRSRKRQRPIKSRRGREREYGRPWKEPFGCRGQQSAVQAPQVHSLQPGRLHQSTTQCG